MLEMLSQARGLSFEITQTPLEAALLEPDEIKRHRPPYNIALTLEDRQVWFASRDLAGRSPHASPRHPVGPIPSADTLDRFAALVRGSPAALGRGRWAPSPALFETGCARMCAAHPELSRSSHCRRSALLRLGVRLWREGRRDHDGEPEEGAERFPTAWTPELAQRSLEWLVLRMVLALRRATWLTRIAEASLVWGEPGVEDARLLVVADGELASRSVTDRGVPPPVPPGWRRPLAERRSAFTLARLDRLTVLTTELKRLVAQGAPVALRLDAEPPLEGRRLARVLSRL
jgi:DNA polymerase-3 subunit epsilon